MRTVSICDMTLIQEHRRAESALSFRERLEISKLLDRLRPYAIELPPIKNERIDALLIQSIAAAVQSSRLVLPAALSEEGVNAAWNAVCQARHPVIEIPAPVSTVQMEYNCHKKPDQMLKEIGLLVSRAKALCPEVTFSAEDATRAEPAFLYRAVETAIAAGADTVVLCDTAGRMLPDEFSAFIRDAFISVPKLSDVTLGVQCADHMRLSAANAIAAVQQGASLIQTSLSAGETLPLEAFLGIVSARGQELGLRVDINGPERLRLKKQVEWMLQRKHSTMTPFENGVSEPASTGWLLTAESALPEVAAAVKKLGYDLSEEDIAKVYEAFGPIAARKDVGEKELDAIIASAALQVPPTYTLNSYVINCGNVITATAHIKLLKKERMIQGFGLGDGPIDAAFLAIEQIIGRHYELDDFQIQAVTEGREAMGSSLVRLRSEGRLYSGKGISTDVIGASIRAYINALNKIAYEEAMRQ